MLNKKLFEPIAYIIIKRKALSRKIIILLWWFSGWEIKTQTPKSTRNLYSYCNISMYFLFFFSLSLPLSNTHTLYFHQKMNEKKILHVHTRTFARMPGSCILLAFFFTQSTRILNKMFSMNGLRRRRRRHGLALKSTSYVVHRWCHGWMAISYILHILKYT